MTAYVVLFRESPVRDPGAMAEYRRVSALNTERHGMEVLAVYGAQQPLEGEPPDGVVILAFPTAADARAWYDSPGYQAAVGHRLAGADYRGVIVEGFDPAAFAR